MEIRGAPTGKVHEIGRRRTGGSVLAFVGMTWVQFTLTRGSCPRQTTDALVPTHQVDTGASIPTRTLMK